MTTLSPPSRPSLLLALLAVLALLGACQQSKEATTNYKELLAQGALLVDVRSDREFRAGSLPGAIHVPHDQAEARLSAFGSKDHPVVLFCARGGRAGRVKSLLESRGWSRVYNAGGINDLR